ncbi:MAG: hypothetical protein KJI71_05010 [Patescibacteria group bacterium]|nr:hypothetical protein [Patescibacteria group bacterium]
MCRPCDTGPRGETPKLEEVESFGAWWITKDGNIQLENDLLKDEGVKGFTREEAGEITPQVRGAEWGPIEIELARKYSLVTCSEEQFYVKMSKSSLTGRIVVETPYLTNCDYGRTSDPSQILESKRGLLH